METVLVHAGGIFRRFNTHGTKKRSITIAPFVKKIAAWYPHRVSVDTGVNT